nr:aminoacyl-tRNA synthetase, class 1a, anticodon-binding [Tanacetum cinerariifolium]
MKKPKFTPFADLSEDQLMSIFGEGPPFRFELCNIYLTYDKIPHDLKLFGTIQAAIDFSPDPLLPNVSFDVFNREFTYRKMTTRIDEDEAMQRRLIQNPDVKAKQQTTAITLQPRKPLQDLANHDGNKKLRSTEFYYHSVPFKKEETEPAKKFNFSDLTEEELTKKFSGLPPFRFEFCSGFLIYYYFLADLKLFGTIQAAAGDFSPDPLLQQNGFSDVFNREFDKPVHVSACGYNELHDLLYCSLPLSSTTSVVQILAKLYVTTDKVDEKKVKVPTVVDDDDVRAFEKEKNLIFELCSEREKKDDFCKVAAQLKTACTIWSPQDKDLDYIDNEAFQVCDDHAFINLSDKPNGGSGKNIFKCRDGSLELYYVALKYAVDAHLEVEFVPPSKKSKLTGRVKAYFGKDFCYDHPADDYHVLLFETDPPAYLKGGKINLMRSVLAVPAKFSLIIEADFYDNISGNDFLSGTYEFSVPLDGSPSFGSIASTDCSLKLKVNWMLPFEKAKFPSSPIYPPASNSSVSRLTERRKFGAPSTSAFADPDANNRWSLQEEIEKVFNTSLIRTFGGDHQQTVSCCISTCAKEDGCDYICSSVLHIWHELRETRSYGGPNCAGLAVKDNIMGSEYKDMIEKCVVCGPGFVKFKLSGKWIA